MSGRSSLFGRSTVHGILMGLVVAVTATSGCADHSKDARALRLDRQKSVAAADTGADHISAAMSIVDQLVTLNPDAARRQIKFHLARWTDRHRDDIAVDVPLPEPFEDVRDVVDLKTLGERFAATAFNDRDVDHLRDAYLTSHLVGWVDREPTASSDPVLVPWLDEIRNAAGDDADAIERARSIRTASRIFDFMVRNVTTQPLLMAPPGTGPEMPPGIDLGGPGYRQSMYQTLLRGSGDWFSNAAVFCAICRAANLDAAIIAINRGTSVIPWCVGVAVGEEMYLYDFELGIHIPGPGGVGIATLRQARTDESVLRRMNVTGFFDYPYDRDMVQSCVALVPMMPEACSPRMQALQRSLAGKNRMVVAVDADAVVQTIDQCAGVADVRIWDVPLKVELYDEAVTRLAEREPQIGFMVRGMWMMLEADIPSSKQLALGRWQQLCGRWDDDTIESRDGARSIFMNQRQPEFEIEDLRTDPNLQMRYNLRRTLGTTDEQYDRQIQMVQQLMRTGKRTATFWLASLQYDDFQFDNAAQWLSERVIDDNEPFIWDQAAKYTLARANEKRGKIDEAIRLYKTVGLTNEHGNRLRARLLGNLDE